MTLPEAVEILNREQHRGYNQWEVGTYAGTLIDDPPFARGSAYYDHLSAFEAIAIAEVYERLHRNRRQDLADLHAHELARQALGVDDPEAPVTSEQLRLAGIAVRIGIADLCYPIPKPESLHDLATKAEVLAEVCRRLAERSERE